LKKREKGVFSIQKFGKEKPAGWAPAFKPSQRFADGEKFC